MIYEWRTYEAMPGKLPALQYTSRSRRRFIPEAWAGRAGILDRGVRRQPPSHLHVDV